MATMFVAGAVLTEHTSRGQSLGYTATFAAVGRWWRAHCRAWSLMVHRRWPQSWCTFAIDQLWKTRHFLGGWNPITVHYDSQYNRSQGDHVLLHHQVEFFRSLGWNSLSRNYKSVSKRLDMVVIMTYRCVIFSITVRVVVIWNASRAASIFIMSRVIRISVFGLFFTLSLTMNQHFSLGSLFSSTFLLLTNYKLC